MPKQETDIDAGTGTVEAYEFGPFRVDVAPRRLSQGEEPISLPSRVPVASDKRHLVTVRREDATRHEDGVVRRKLG